MEYKQLTDEIMQLSALSQERADTLRKRIKDLEAKTVFVDITKIEHDTHIVLAAMLKELKAGKVFNNEVDDIIAEARVGFKKDSKVVQWWHKRRHYGSRICVFDYENDAGYGRTDSEVRKELFTKIPRFAEFATKLNLIYTDMMKKLIEIHNNYTPISNPYRSRWHRDTMFNTEVLLFQTDTNEKYAHKAGDVFEEMKSIKRLGVVMDYSYTKAEKTGNEKHGSFSILSNFNKVKREGDSTYYDQIFFLTNDKIYNDINDLLGQAEQFVIEYRKQGDVFTEKASALFDEYDYKQYLLLNRL
jgi:hypothetical protein